MEPASLAGGGGSERRQERKPLRTNAMLRVPGAAPIRVRTLDISVGGMGVVASLNPHPGVACSMAIAPPASASGAPTIAIPATVVHSIFSVREGGFVIGLRYGELSDEAVEAITRFLS